MKKAGQQQPRISSVLRFHFDGGLLPLPCYPIKYSRCTPTNLIFIYLSFQKDIMKHCSAFQVVHLLGKKWTIPLLEEISLRERQGFVSLSRRTRKITPKVLSSRLKELKSLGCIQKQEIGGAILHTEYTLTPTGREVMDMVRSLKQQRCTPDRESGCIKACIDCDLY